MNSNTEGEIEVAWPQFQLNFRTLKQILLTQDGWQEPVLQALGKWESKPMNKSIKSKWINELIKLTIDLPLEICSALEYLKSADAFSSLWISFKTNFSPKSYCAQTIPLTATT